MISMSRVAKSGLLLTSNQLKKWRGVGGGGDKYYS